MGREGKFNSKIKNISKKLDICTKSTITRAVKYKLISKVSEKTFGKYNRTPTVGRGEVVR